MRLLPVLFLFLAPLVARAEPLAARFPAGATAYLEARGLAGKVDAALTSPLGEALQTHPGYQQFLQSPEGRQILFAQAALQGATGLDFKGVLDALAGKEIALAVYGVPQRMVAMARVEPEMAARLISGVEILSQTERFLVQPADDEGPALWRLGPVYLLVDGDLLVLSPDEALASAVRDRSAAGLQQDVEIEEARRLSGAGADVFAYIDLKAYGARMRKKGKPKELGEALIAGAFPYYVRSAPWCAVRADLQPAGDTLRFRVQGFVPAPAEPPAAVARSFSGTLEPLPFALPERTIAVARLRRSLPAIWSNREELIAERGIPGLVEFETNFGNLTGGMDFVEQFLPALRDSTDMVFLATRRLWPAGGPRPAIRAPQGAFLLPVKDSPEFAVKMQIAFQTGIGVINASQGMMGNAFLLHNETHKGVAIQSARYLPPSRGEQAALSVLPVRYNLEPSIAIVNGYFVFASTPGIIKELIDAQQGSAPVRPGVNAGLWIEAAEALKALAENREPLIAQSMMEDGLDRATAEKNIDLLLDLGRYVRSLALTAEESRASLGLMLDVVLGAAREDG